MALGGYVRERVTEVCGVKPAKGAGLDPRDWEPVGEESFKEICIRTGLPVVQMLELCLARHVARVLFRSTMQRPTKHGRARRPWHPRCR
jgi:hypothetical protein